MMNPLVRLAGAGLLALSLAAPAQAQDLGALQSEAVGIAYQTAESAPGRAR